MSNADDNRSVLLAIKNTVAQTMSRLTYDFGRSNESELRCPNENEQKNWLLEILREKLLDAEITTQQYRSVKGEIRKGHFENVFNFLIKIGDTDIRDRFNKYSTSKIMLSRKVKVTFPEPVKVQLIDIKIKGGN